MRSLAVVAHSNGSIIAVGGKSADRTVLSSVEMLIVSRNEWMPLPPLPTAVSNACTAFDDKTKTLYVFGT